MDKSDRYFLASSVIVPLIVWWLFIGRTKYGAPRGMK